MGLAGSYGSMNVDLGRFVFTDQLLSGSSSTTDSYRFDRLNYFDMHTGIVAFSEQYWLGASVSNLAQAWSRTQTIFPTKLSVHGGLLIPILKDAKGDFYRNITVAGQYKAQQDFDQLDIGAYYGYSLVLVGVWYRGLLGLKDNETSITNHDAIALIFGLNYEAFRLSYSYDISTSTLHTYSFGSHEVSLQIEIGRNHKYKRKRWSERNVPCPNFGGPGWQLGKS